MVTREHGKCLQIQAIALEDRNTDNGAVGEEFL
jgi:hypothetical protein